jgi:hypothetical protein
MSDRDISKLYSESVSKRKFDTIGDRFNEATVVVKYEDGTKAKFNLEDEYVRSLERRINVESGGVDEIISDIFNRGKFTGLQVEAKSALRDLLVSHPYSHSLELFKYLSTTDDSNKLNFSDIFTSGVIDFTDSIIRSLPDKFIQAGVDSLRDLIHKTHLNVTPKDSTGVGLGESTFAFFGTATKAQKHGDLEWDGHLVEIKTNGKGLNKKGRPTQTGATLAGDGTFNTASINKLLELKGLNGSQYKHRKIGLLERVKGMLVNIQELRSADPDQAEQVLRQLQSFLKNQPNLWKSQSSLQVLLTDLKKLDDLDNKLINIKGNPKLPEKIIPGADSSLYNVSLNSIQKQIDSWNKLEQNWVSQANVYFELCETPEEVIEGFSIIRTEGGCSTSNDVRQFFKENNPMEFIPSVNIGNFERLIGAISIACYQQVGNFDFITAIDDYNHKMSIIDCRQASVVNIYKQLLSNPAIVFDLGIDVSDIGSGKMRTATSRAKAPRIKLAI